MSVLGADLQIDSPKDGTWLAASEEPGTLKIEGRATPGSEVRFTVKPYLGGELNQTLKADKQGKFSSKIDQYNIVSNTKTQLMFSSKGLHKSLSLFCCSNSEGFYAEVKPGADYSVDVSRPGSYFNGFGVRAKKEGIPRETSIMISDQTFEIGVPPESYIPLTKAFEFHGGSILFRNLKIIIPVQALKPLDSISIETSVENWESLYDRKWKSFVKSPGEKVVLGFSTNGDEAPWKEIPSVKQSGDRYMIDLDSCSACQYFLVAAKIPKKK